MDYFNPGSFMQGDSTIESPFLRAMDRGTRQNMAAPFIEMMQANQGLDLQKKQVENQEFMSPMATQARQTGHELKTQQNRQTMRSLPWTTDRDIAQAKADLEAMPHMTAKTIAEAQAAAQKAQGTPAQALFNDIAAINDHIKKLPPEQRALRAQSLVDQVRARYPGAKLPESLTTYNPEAWDIFSLAAINSAEHQRALAANKQKEDAHKERNDSDNMTKIKVAEIGAEGRILAAEERGRGSVQRPPNESQHRVQLRDILSGRTPVSPEEKAAAAQAMRGYVEEEVRKEVLARQMEIIQQSSNQNIPADKKVTYDSIRRQVYQRNGIREDGTLTSQEPTPLPAGTPKEVTIQGQKWKVLSANPDGTFTIQNERGETKRAKP